MAEGLVEAVVGVEPADGAGVVAVDGGVPARVLEAIPMTSTSSRPMTPRSIIGSCRDRMKSIKSLKMDAKRSIYCTYRIGIDV